MIEQEVQQCTLCLEDLESDLFFFGCHIFHQDCIRKHVKGCIDQQIFPIKCPQQHCPNSLDYMSISELNQPELLEKFTEFALKDYLTRNNKNTIHCPTPNCPFVFQYQFTCEIPDRNRPVHGKKCKECDKYFCRCCKEIVCEACSKPICVFCREIHPGLSCYQHNFNKGLNSGYNLFVKFIKEAKFKKCPECQFWVEKSMGCNHMVCRCGHQFCYECSGKYMNCYCRQGRQKVKAVLDQIYPKEARAFKPIAPPKPKKVPKPQQNREVLKGKVFDFPNFGRLNV